MKKNEEKLFFILNKFTYPFLVIMPKSMIRVFLIFFTIGESKLFFGIRYILYKRLFKSLGDKVIFFPFLTIKSPQNIKIGTNVSINHNCFLEGAGGIDIGSNVMIAHQVSIMSNSHITKNINIPMKAQGVKMNKVIIEDNVWIGAKVTILDGITIGEGSILAANSVINKNVNKFSVVGGVPAKFIKNRLDESSK